MTHTPTLLSQNAHSLVMVRPRDFGYNPQTGTDNSFQHEPDQASPETIRAQAMSEFEAMVKLLRSKQIQVIVLDKSPSAEQQPDAVFPNNWFSIDHQGTLFIYPMKTPNRQAEVQIEPLLKQLSHAGTHIKQVIDLREEGLQPALEGTGSLIFHHPTRRVFAAISERCDQHRLESFARQIGYQPISCQTKDSDGSAIYHTNVLMSVGEEFAVVCAEVIVEGPEKEAFLAQLQSTVSDVIYLSERQMGHGFCGNILQVKNQAGQPYIVMSASAWPLFDEAQQAILRKHGEPILCPIHTIERIGGGSARCMIAENFSAN